MAGLASQGFRIIGSLGAFFIASGYIFGCPGYSAHFSHLCWRPG